MSVPNFLFAPSLFPAQDAVDPGDSCGFPELRASTMRALEQLADQRSAVLSRELPRIVRVLNANGAEPGRQALEETLSLLGSPAQPPDFRAEMASEIAAASLQFTSGGNAVADYVRLAAIKRAADEGVRTLARARLRLAAFARRLEASLEDNRADVQLAAPERRALESAARLAAVAATAARHPLLAEDGGIDRRFSAGLRQLRG